MEYQLSRNKIEQLKSLQFKINWTLLKIAHKGSGVIPPLLTIKDICQYAEKCLELMDSDYDLVAQLALEKNEYDFCDCLDKLVKSEAIDYQLQIRKWRVLLVFDQLQNLSKDYTEGLLELSELWVSLGLPADCPHIIQGRNNIYTPQDYYTTEMYNRIVGINKEWLEKETAFIIASEK